MVFELQTSLSPRMGEQYSVGCAILGLAQEIRRSTLAMRPKAFKLVESMPFLLFGFRMRKLRSKGNELRTEVRVGF
jgi:hypothetical protein